jgi:hypothetical protein
MTASLANACGAGARSQRARIDALCNAWLEQGMMIDKTCTPPSANFALLATDCRSACSVRGCVGHMSAQRFAMDKMRDAHMQTDFFSNIERNHDNGASTHRAV